MTAQQFLPPDAGQAPKTSRWWKILVLICLYCLNCTKFGQLILRKIIKVIATRCQILRLKCTKFDFGWGSAKGAGSHREGMGKGGQRDGEGKEGEGRREGRERGGEEGRADKRQREWEGWELTWDGMGREGKVKGERGGKGRRWATAPNFNSWCLHWLGLGYGFEFWGFWGHCYSELPVLPPCNITWNCPSGNVWGESVLGVMS